MTRYARLVAPALLLAASLAVSAQQTSPQPSPPAGSVQGMQGVQGSQRMGPQGGAGGQGMQGGSMCDPRCGGMMEKEMKAYPWKMAYATAFGVLSLIALALLVVLEVLWIRLWSMRVARLKADPAPKEQP